MASSPGFASTATAQDADGNEVPVAHACGHDIHVSCRLGMTKLMADQPGRWNGTLLALFQPAEETGDGAQGMIDDGLLTRIPARGRRPGPARPPGRRRHARNTSRTLLVGR